MNEEKEKIACHVCKKMIPKAAAVHSEGMEYVLHFCNTECLDYWKKEKKEKKQDWNLLFCCPRFEGLVFDFSTKDIFGFCIQKSRDPQLTTAFFFNNITVRSHKICIISHKK